MDFIIVQKDGEPLCFGEGRFENAKEIVIYGDYYDAKEDLDETDTCICQVSYGESDNGEPMASVEVTGDGDYLGSFTYEDNDNDLDLHKKLYQFIIENFKAKEQ